jgi:hypothetical protein
MKKLSYRIFLTFLLILSINILLIKVSYSQVTQEWVAIYDNPNHTADISRGMVVDANGNIYVAGLSQTLNNRSTSITIKYNSTGVQQWVKVYDDLNSIDTKPTGISIDSSGNVFVMGTSGDEFNYTYHAVLIKYNSNGDTLWVKKYYGSTNTTYPYALANDKYGNTYMTGIGGQFFLIKYSSNGDTLWNRTYKPTGYDGSIGTSIALDSLNNIYIGGRCWFTFPPPNRNDFMVVKFSTLGSLIWCAKDSIRLTDDYEEKMAIDRDGNAICTGTTTTTNGGSAGWKTVKFGNNNGALLWSKIHYDLDGTPVDIVTDRIGNIYISGPSINYQLQEDDYKTIKYNTVGDTIWIRRFAPHGGAVIGANNLKIDVLDNIYVLGLSRDSNNNYYYSTIKYNSNGFQQWLTNYPANWSSATKFNLTVDRYFNVYVCSSAAFQAQNLDIVTIKYAQPVGVVNNSNIPFNFDLKSNYPNPFNSSTKIKYEIGHTSIVNINIYDILGRLVTSYKNQIKNAGMHEEIWEANIFASGIYFCRFNAEYTEDNSIKQFNKTITMVLTK